MGINRSTRDETPEEEGRPLILSNYDDGDSITGSGRAGAIQLLAADKTPRLEFQLELDPCLASAQWATVRR